MIGKPVLVCTLVMCCLAFTFIPVTAQNDVLMQAFYWDVPVDDTNLNGFWWDSLRVKAPDLATAGISAIWTPAPSKGAWSIFDMGYGVYDHYDLGEYMQKGNVDGVPASTETRFGSRAELVNMVNSMHSNGIEVYSDIVLNHMFGGVYENNPAVKNYIEEHNAPSYPTSTVKWRIPNAAPGDYFIQVTGFNLDWTNLYERTYELQISWKATADCSPSATPGWESEPNNGGGNTTTFTGSGCSMWAHTDYQNDIDEYKITVSSTADIEISLVPKRESPPGTVVWAGDNNGYRVNAVWYNGQNLYSQVEARTFTNFSYAQHDAGVPQWTWNYQQFHPADINDFLQDQGFEDEVRPNWMLFGPDFNTFDVLVQNRFIAWGQWLTNTIGFDGYRLDFVRGIQETYIGQWLNAMPLQDGQQRFAVGEYWTSQKYRLKNWANDVATAGATSSVFDFTLRDDLKRMCNNNDNFKMYWLDHSGMVRDNTGNSLPASNVVTFLENHDTGKEHDKWVTQDWKMGYAYMLFAQGRPTIFYPHFFGDTLRDAGNTSLTVVPDPGLRQDLTTLIGIRKDYLENEMEVLTEVGNPVPATAIDNVFIARRKGNGSNLPGAFLVLNNNFTQTLGAWVTANVDGWPLMTNQLLTNITSGNSETVRITGDGRVELTSPARGYAVYAIDRNFVSIDFAVSNATTVWGQNVYLVGSVAELGNWDANSAVGPLDASNYPTWNLHDFYLPPSTAIQYKYIKKDGSGNVVWESGSNHSYTTPASGTGSVSDTWSAGSSAAAENLELQAQTDLVVLPEKFALHQNFPNPFNPETEIRYDVAREQAGQVSVVIINMLGQRVRGLLDEFKSAGSHRVVWNGRNDSGNQVPSGVYLYQISVKGTDSASLFKETRKMTLLR